VLCGHWHIPWVWRLNNILIISAGTVCSSKIRGKIPQCYNLIEVYSPERDCICWHLKVYKIFSEEKREQVFDGII